MKARARPMEAPPKWASWPMFPMPLRRAQKEPTRYRIAKRFPGISMGMKNMFMPVPGTRKMLAKMVPQTPPEAPRAA